MSATALRLRGKVAAKLGDHIDTDLIYPGRFLNITDREKTPQHLFELAHPEIRELLRSGDFLVAGKNFGCGSSREQATSAIKLAGCGAVIAASFARIFFRNSINLGCPWWCRPRRSRACSRATTCLSISPPAASSIWPRRRLTPPPRSIPRRWNCWKPGG